MRLAGLGFKEFGRGGDGNQLGSLVQTFVELHIAVSNKTNARRVAMQIYLSRDNPDTF